MTDDAETGQRATGWQPIETAPKDGTRFIAWFPPCLQMRKGGWHECQWVGDSWLHPFFVDPILWFLPTPPARSAT